MFRSKEEILAELDSTLNQLLLNIETVSDVSLSEISETEMQAMHKTQESLMARFMHTSELIKENERKKLQETNVLIKLQEKLKKFSELNTSFIKSVSSELSSTSPMPRKKPRIGKNRKGLKTS